MSAIQAAGPEFKPARTETLSDYLEPVGSSRHGGLYLAQQSTQRERRLVAAAATGELSLGGTLVNDGAKLSTRKRGMLNSSLVTAAGVNYLQSTDATGQTKNAEFLVKDYSTAIEKAGHFEVHLG